MRTLLLSSALLVLIASVGCKRSSSTAPAEAGAGNYSQDGPLGLSVESVKLGKVRLRGMMGQEGESKDDVFVVKTRFKLLDPKVSVKQGALQRDGEMFTIGDGGMKLTDERGTRFKPVVGGGFDNVKARRSGDAVLTAENPEATDFLTFESVASAVGDLTLEVPANYWLRQPDGSYSLPKERGAFRVRIPKAMWSAPPPTTDAGPGNGATVGPVSASVEAVRVGKVKIQRFGVGGGIGDSQEDVFAVTVKVKLADPAARVKKPPFLTGGPAAAFTGVAVTLRSATGGDPFPAVTAFGLNQIVGRQEKDVELTAAKPELTDLLTFDAKAAGTDELILTLWPKWQEPKPDGTWADASHEGDFRFRIPKSMWAK